MRIVGAGTSGNVVQGNYIGTAVNGTADLGNTRNGVFVGSAATGNTALRRSMPGWQSHDLADDTSRVGILAPWSRANLPTA